MSRHPTGRVVALCASVALLASFTVAVPVAAEETYTCLGHEATIVGTAGADVLEGTPGADVIVGRGGADIIYGLGGNDLICGGLGADRIVGNGGNDRILGNAGPDRMFGGRGHDRMFGGVGNDLLAGRKGSDLLDGGPGTDRCYQNLGSGIEARCELPAKVVKAPEPKNLAVAYSNLDGVDGFQEGGKDVLIAKLVDTNLDGVLSKGDSVVMGKYPTKLQPGAPYAAWSEKNHVVEKIDLADKDEVHLISTSGGTHVWITAEDQEVYSEGGTVNGASPAVSRPESGIGDWILDDSEMDKITVQLGSPSLPATAACDANTDPGSQSFLDVDINVKVTY